MSRAEYLACLGSSRKSEGKELLRGLARGAGTSGSADRVLVGVCIFRLDGRTLRPAVLLLRRSPRWWQQQMMSSGRKGAGGAGDWELPGGKVRDDDFCISSAIERLVREKTGLKVTRIMEMLHDVRWTTEFKVMLWDVDGEENKTTKRGREGGYGRNGQGDDYDKDDGSETKKKTELGSGITSGHGMSTERKTNRPGSESVVDMLRDSYLDALGIRIPSNSTSASSSPVWLTPDLSSCTPPPPPPKDDRVHGHGYKHVDHEYGHGDHDYPHQREDHVSEYHDFSLEPPPLAIPLRSPRRLNPYKAEERDNKDKHTLPPLPAPDPPADAPAPTPPPLSPRRHRRMTPVAATTGPDRRYAQLIPNQTRRRDYVQLNYTVLVDEYPAEEEEEPVPRFLLGSRRGGGEEEEGREMVYEHDALEWATVGRVEGLPMNEDLRRVVFQGLDWMGRLTGGFF